MGGLRAKAAYDSALGLIAKRFRGENEDMVQQPLPERWVALIHQLNERERRQSAPAQAKAEPSNT